MSLDDDGASFEDVETLLDADLDNFENELDELYSKVERYSEVADVMDSAGRGDDAEYFRELAVDSYESFVYAMQLKKDADDYNF